MQTFYNYFNKSFVTVITVANEFIFVTAVA